MARPTLGEPIRYRYYGVQKRLELASRYLAGKSIEMLLDVGCGNGAYTIELARDAGTVYAVDIERKRLREFSERLTQQELNNVVIVQGPAERLPLRSDVFDGVYCIETLEHVVNEQKALREIGRVLKPGGWAVWFVPNRWYLFETHGLRWSWLRGNRIPFISWLPKFVHDRVANARIYTRTEMQALLIEAGFVGIRFDSMLPPMDRVGSKILQRLLRQLIRFAEPTVIRRFGVSLFVIAHKPEAPAT